MKDLTKQLLKATCLAVVIAAGTFPVSGAPRRSEGELIRMLQSQNYRTVIDALDRLPNWYPQSTNAVIEIKALLRTRAVVLGPVPPYIVPRKAARALGDYHAELDWNHVNMILAFTRSSDPDEVMDGLKALRGLKEPRDIQEKITAAILPLLQDSNAHIVRDTCRTLAVVGNKETIPHIEPLLKDRRSDVKKDARDAIASLNTKL